MIKFLLVPAVLLVSSTSVSSFVPLLDGGKKIPNLYDCYFNDQIAKQASTAVSKAISAGKKKIEVNFPPVPNVDEVKFGTPLNQKFGKQIVAKDLKVVAGYTPGSELSRNLIAFSNVFWAKKIAGGLGASPIGGKPVAVLTTERVIFNDIKNMGPLSRFGIVMSDKSRKEGRNGEAVVCINPGGEEGWERIASAHTSPGSPFVVLNNSYSTSYDLGNKRGFEEAYYLKRISKGWIFRTFPGPWEAYLEKPDGSCELLTSFKTKPKLGEVAKMVREESFKRYAIFNDRYAKGFGERL